MTSWLLTNTWDSVCGHFQGKVSADTLFRGKCPRTLFPESVHGHCVGLLGWCQNQRAAKILSPQCPAHWFLMLEIWNFGHWTNFRRWIRFWNQDPSISLLTCKNFSYAKIYFLFSSGVTIGSADPALQGGAISGGRKIARKCGIFFGKLNCCTSKIMPFKLQMYIF